MQDKLFRKTITEHDNLIARIIMKHGVQSSDTIFDDLMQEGRMAVLKYQPTYKKEKGKESTYFYPRIRRAIQHFLANNSKPVNYGCYETMLNNFDNSMSLNKAISLTNNGTLQEYFTNNHSNPHTLLVEKEKDEFVNNKITKALKRLTVEEQELILMMVIRKKQPYNNSDRNKIMAYRNKMGWTICFTQTATYVRCVLLEKLRKAL